MFSKDDDVRDILLGGLLVDKIEENEIILVFLTSQKRQKV